MKLNKKEKQYINDKLEDVLEDVSFTGYTVLERIDAKIRIKLELERIFIKGKNSN